MKQKNMYKFFTGKLRNIDPNNYKTSSYAIEETDNLINLLTNSQEDISIKKFSSGMIRDVDKNKLKPYLLFPKDIPYDLQIFKQVNLPSDVVDKISNLDKLILQIYNQQVYSEVIIDAMQILFDIEGYSFLDRIIIHYSNGSKKYEERNWEKGINDNEVLERYGESLFRHYISWANNETNEDHAAAIAFNLAGIYQWMLLKVKLLKNQKNL